MKNYAEWYPLPLGLAAVCLALQVATRAGVRRSVRAPSSIRPRSEVVR